jgi:hypothetical protein
MEQAERIRRSVTAFKQQCATARFGKGTDNTHHGDTARSISLTRSVSLVFCQAFTTTSVKF